MSEKTIYDTVIIGAGPAGMTAAVYASRANMKTALLERGIPGGQLMNTEEIENYTGFEMIGGPELSQKMFDHALKFGAEYLFGNVNNIEREGEHLLKIVTDDGAILSKSVIVATGTKHRNLEVPGEESLSGRGVSYCAVCDGNFFKGKEVVVVGGGDSAVEEALYLSKLASKVTIVHRRDKLRAQEIIQKRAFGTENISFIWDTVVKEIQGDSKVSSVLLENTKTGESSQLLCDGVFIYVGMDPISQFAQSLGVLDESGYVMTDSQMATSHLGVFAAGDVRVKTLRQVANAVGDGSEAAISAYHYVEKLNDLL